MDEIRQFDAQGWEATISGDLCSISSPFGVFDIIGVNAISDNGDTMFTWSSPTTQDSILIADPCEFHGVTALEVAHVYWHNRDNYGDYDSVYIPIAA
ncbi:hypothetical protein [Corynebacterium singulare]|uniref:Uncharacterized protein n=1 Tax=Corynebacterium singulare TaxID=161899 RepID=A0A0B6EVD7_9CORY|nr:hypothetical protein [Corynebacterium singulare]AJI78803.1 hypothetical protein CSING_06350 [Corynebacterium singulare]